ncbi:hypothetical protein G6714_04535 [Polynucleobacter paneuropaeus]|nr:hypothetical protein [Polynucleobacter paneuropaeus]
MPVQMIELEEVTMMDVSDDALEAEVIVVLAGNITGGGTTSYSCSTSC